MPNSFYIDWENRLIQAYYALFFPVYWIISGLHHTFHYYLKFNSDQADSDNLSCFYDVFSKCTISLITNSLFICM